MAFSIRTNVASLNAQKNLFNNTAQLEKSMSRLSSGMRMHNLAVFYQCAL